jgi:hypothetical protein
VTYKLQYFDEAIEDIKNSKLWYEEKQNGLELLFAQAIEECINRILTMPTAYAIRYRKILIAHPKRFPYNILFYSDEKNSAIVIVSVIHNKRLI